MAESSIPNRQSTNQRPSIEASQCLPDLYPSFCPSKRGLSMCVMPVKFSDLHRKIRENGAEIVARLRYNRDFHRIYPLERILVWRDGQ
ncbi:hypothetical protein HHK36_009807 [Tetracentron sinense]|uniref:Uncharacterized protein n=1 Tax=Tetracentron sinense TaxID=13715 RepID=A0A835DLN9_TETSI|nr:hypothetical protein HHK36_009807 [Tetracentron sinense]